MSNALRSCCAVAAFTTAIWAAPALAGGVDAGTLIKNTASATFETGGSSATVSSNTVEIKVDELLDVTVASNDGAPVVTSGSAVLSFTVSNKGNGPEAFALTADPAVGGNAYNMTVTGLVLDNGNGIYEPNTDQPLANGGNSPVLIAEGTQVVFVLVKAPEGVADNAVSQVRLRADAVTGTGTAGTVFAGKGEGGGAAVTGLTEADGDALGAVRASVTAVKLVKSYTVADPFKGSQPVPGATVTFTIRAEVTGSGSAANLVIRDPIPAGTTYTKGSLKLNDASLSDDADSDAGAFASDAISVAVGTVAANANPAPTVTFDVTINQEKQP